MKKIWERSFPLLIFLVFALLSVGMTYPLLFNLPDHVPSDLGDPLYNVWVMNWDLQALKSGLKGFWDTNIFYPHRGTLFYADYLPALAILSAPLRALTRNVILTYNLLFLLSFFLCAVGMYVLVFHLTRKRASAVIAGLIFAFFPYRFAHISHLELLYFAWIPFCFLFLHKFFKNPSAGNLAGFGFFVILQFLSCAYYGVFLALFAGLLIVFFAYKKGFIGRIDFWFKMGILGLVCFLPLVLFFFPYIKVHQKMLFTRSLLEVNYYSAQLQHFLAVHEWNLAWGWLIGNLKSPEWQLFPGVVPVLMALYWWISRRKERRREVREEKNRLFFWWDFLTIFFLFFLLQIMKSGGFSLHWGSLKLISVHSLRNPLYILGISIILRIVFALKKKKLPEKITPSTNSLAQRFFLFMAIFSWVLSMGPVVRFFDKKLVAGPYSFLYDWIPVFKGLRVPSRLMVITIFAISVISGWALERLNSKWKFRKAHRIALLIIGGLIILEYLSIPIPLAHVKVGDEIPPVYSIVKDLPDDSVLVELPMPESVMELSKEALYMYYSIYHGKRLVNGYSGYFPPGYTVIREAMQCFPTERTFELLKGLEINYILIHTGYYRSKKMKETVRILGGYQDQVELLAEVQGDYIYRLLPSEKELHEEKEIHEFENRENWTAKSNHNNVLTGLAFDGNRETAWTSGTPQREGDYFLIDFGSERKIGQIEFIVSDFPLDFPRGFILEGSVDMEQWELLEENTCFFPGLSRSIVEDLSEYRIVIFFNISKVRFLRITLTKSHENCHWSFQEIRLWGRNN